MDTPLAVTLAYLAAFLVMGFITCCFKGIGDEATIGMIIASIVMLLLTIASLLVLLGARLGGG